METITAHAMFRKGFLKDIPIEMLHSGTYQPRTEFSEEALASLTKTIEQLGVLEPLIVRASKQHPNKFEIIAGERRFRAAKRAGFLEVPCLISNYTNEQAAQIALIENTCRDELDPVSEARALERLTDDFHYTHDEIASLLSVSRSYVSNMLRILCMDRQVQGWIAKGTLSKGHAKVLAGVRYEDQYKYAYDTLRKEWSVRLLDEAIKADKDQKAKTQKGMPPLSPVNKQLTAHFGMPAKVTINKNQSGHFRIPFQDASQMQIILDKLGIKETIE